LFNPKACGAACPEGPGKAGRSATCHSSLNSAGAFQGWVLGTVLGLQTGALAGPAFREYTGMMG